MRKFQVEDIGDFHYRQLMTLVKFGMAEAHIVVTRCKVEWPQTWDAADRRSRGGIPRGVGIH